MMPTPLATRDAVGLAPLELRVHRSIDEIEPALWDSLLEPDDLQATHRFVRTCERSRVEDAQFRHVVVLRNGVPQAIASFAAFRVGLDVLATGFARSVLTAVRRAWPNTLRVSVVFCGLPVSFGKSALRIAAGADDRAVLRLLARVADEFAADVRAPVICFKEFDAVESRRLEPLADSGYLRVPSLPGCRLQLRWRSSAEWTSAMRAAYRRQLLASRRIAADHGLAARHAGDWREHASRIHALYDQVIERAEFKLERLPLAFFECLAEMPEARAILIERNDALVAAAIVLDGPTESTFLIVGMDYAVSRAVGAYHAVVDEVLVHAFRRGARAVELGQTSYDHKTRLGAVGTSRDLFIRCRPKFGHRAIAAFRRTLFPETSVPSRRVFRDDSPR